MDNHFLGPIEEYVLRIHTPLPFSQHPRSALSDTQPSLTPTDVTSSADSDEEEVFTYPVADGHNDGDDHVDDDDEFVYPDTSVNIAHQDFLIASDDSLPEHALEAALDSALEETNLVETSPSLLSSPPPAQAPSHPSPAQLEALSAAASQGDLVLLKKLFATALQGGHLEAFALANDASSRTGFTALHAAASRGYPDIVKWREYWMFLNLSHHLYDHVLPVIEDCGAMPDLEDREGEVSTLLFVHCVLH